MAVLTAAKGGVVQGVVIEQASGRPMERTRVRLQPVPNAASDARLLMARAGSSGHFLFPAVPDGLYLLTAVREHYFPASYGQRLPNGQGIPIQVTADSDLFTELRMRRMGAITGRILDPNGVGLPGVHVIAYRARLPLRVARDAVSDDRGIYRIHGLDPGKYWIRSAAQTLDDGSGLLPTFSPETRESREARAYPAAVDTETPDADLHPMPGRLFHLGGYLQCEPMGAPVAVFLASETGRRGITAYCAGRYLFENLAPAAYEIFAEKEGGGDAGFLEMFVDRDSETGTIQLGPQPVVSIVVEGSAGAAITRPSFLLTGRRQDLTESGPEREIKMPQSTLAPGYWEIGARTGPGEYIESITNLFGGPRRTWRAERSADWFEVFVDARPQSRFKVIVSGKAGSIAGNVQSDGKAVPGIPVFVWPVAEQARRSLRGPLLALSDVNGRFQFGSLPPGDYRMMATFDLSEVDEESMEVARAVTVHVEPSQTATVALTPWVAP